MANRFKNASGLVSITPTNIYICPSTSRSGVIHALYITNLNDAVEIKVTIEVFDSSTNHIHKIIYKIPIPIGSTLVIDKVINLEPSDILRISSDTANSTDAFASIVEVV